MIEAVIEVPLEESDPVVDKQRDELLERMRKTPMCMLLTHNESGSMHVRPMISQQVEAPGIVWMFTSAKSHIAQEVAVDPAVLITYADVRDGAFAAVRGHAVTLQDITKQRELWTAVAGAWFPGGAEDPSLTLLRITLSFAEQWEPSAGKVVQFLEIAAAALTNSVPDTEGVYRRIDF